VDVDWRGKGIGTSLLRWSEKYVIRLASFEHPNEPFEFAANASSTEKEATSLLLREGYTAPFTVIDFRLDHNAFFDIPELPLGIEVEPTKPQYIPWLIDSIKKSYESESGDGRYVEPLNEAEYTKIISQPPHDASLWQVAWENDVIVGQVLPVIRDGFGEIYEVSVQKPWRRKHIARVLLLRAISAIRKKGIEDIRVYTLSTFPTQAKELYRSVGFKIYKEFPRYRKTL
jgi:ribosomal protein S18 acetylase RimI-like enzyme